MPQPGVLAFFVTIVLMATLLASTRNTSRSDSSLQSFGRKLYSRIGWRGLHLWLPLSVSLLSSAQDAHSISPVVRELNRWLAAYDDSDWDVYRKFLKTDF